MDKIKHNPDHNLFHTIKQIIDKARQNAIVAVNTELVLMNWHIGNTLNKDNLREERASRMSFLMKIHKKPIQP